MRQKAEEEALLNEALFDCALDENELSNARAVEMFSAVSHSLPWTESRTLKEYQRTTVLAEKDLLAKEQCEFFHEHYDVYCWWLVQYRSKYLFHHSTALPDSKLNGPEVEPSVVVAARKDPLDSPLLTSAGVIGLGQLDHLVRDILDLIMFQQAYSDSKPFQLEEVNCFFPWHHKEWKVACAPGPAH